MRTSWSRALAGLGTGLVALGLAAPALACAPQFICDTRAFFAAGTQIPASAQAIPLMVPQPMQAPYEPLVPELRDAAGKLMQTELTDDKTNGYKLLKPLKGFAADSSYTLVLPGFCKDSFGTDMPPKELKFTTGPVLPAPQTMGTLQLTAVAPDLIAVWTSAGSCTVPIQAARGHAKLTLAPELVPWLPLARAELWVDGAQWAGGGYGDLPTQAQPSQLTKGRTVHEFFVPCAPVPNMADKGLEPGLHHVDVRVHVAGEYNDPPYLYGDLTVNCTGYTDPDAGTATDTAVLPGDTTQAATAKPAASSDGGCSAGRAAIPGAAWLGGVAALGLWAVRRWRRAA